MQQEVDGGALVNVPDTVGVFPIHYAAFFQQAEVTAGDRRKKPFVMRNLHGVVVQAINTGLTLISLLLHVDNTSLSKFRSRCERNNGR